MKKIIPYLVIEILLFLAAMTLPEGIAVFCFLGVFAFPIGLLFYFLYKKVKAKPETNSFVSTKVTEPAEPRKLTYDEYLWLQDTEDIGNRFFKAFKEDLEENDDYHMTKKEILDEYYPGDKIYKYEPFLLPFKVEEGKVYSYINEGEWICVGALKKRDIAKYERSKRTELYLMPNYFKKVYDDEVETDSGDSYFGLLVILEQ